MSEEGIVMLAIVLGCYITIILVKWLERSKKP
jgi:hypothetical protein